MKLLDHILGRGPWYVAIRVHDYHNGKPAYCITNGAQFVGNWWCEMGSPYGVAKRAARKRNRHEVRGMRTAEEIRKDRQLHEAALRQLDRELGLIDAS